MSERYEQESSATRHQNTPESGLFQEYLATIQEQLATSDEQLDLGRYAGAEAHLPSLQLVFDDDLAPGLHDAQAQQFLTVEQATADAAYQNHQIEQADHLGLSMDSIFANHGQNEPSILFHQFLEPQLMPVDENAHVVQGVLSQFSQSAGTFTDAYAMVDMLSRQAASGNYTAQAALGSIMLSLTQGGESGDRLSQSPQAGFSALISPNLSGLDQEEQRALQILTAQELDSFLPAIPLNGIERLNFEDSHPVRTLIIDESAVAEVTMSPQALEYIALSACLSSTPDQTMPGQHLEEMLNGQKHTDSCAYALWSVMQNETVTPTASMREIFIDALSQNEHADHYFSEMGQRAREGNPYAIELLVQVLADTRFTGPQRDNVSNLLVNSDQADHVYEALIEQYQTEESHQVLNCLSSLAATGQLGVEPAEAIMNTLRDAVGSENSTLKRNALEGLMQLSDHWTESDMTLLSDNISFAVDNGLVNRIGELNPETATSLVALLQSNLAAGTYESSFDEMAALTALGALTDYCDASTASLVKDVITTGRFAGSNMLATAGIRTLMAFAGSRGEISFAAIDQILEDDWRSTPVYPLEDPQFRQEIAAFLTGETPRSELSPLVRQIGYDSRLPLPIARIFSDLGVPPERLHELVQSARTNYDDATIRRVLSGAELYNTLPPQFQTMLRGEDTADLPLEVVDPRQVIGQMANGTLDESATRFLLEPIKSKVESMINNVTAELRGTKHEAWLHEERRRENLDGLIELLGDGPNSWEYFISNEVNRTIVDAVNPSFGLTDVTPEQNFVSEYNDQMRAGLVDVRNDRMESTRYAEQIAVLEAQEDCLSIALDTYRYQSRRLAGNESGADSLALEMLSQYPGELEGISPRVWNDLGFSGDTSYGDNVFQRVYSAEKQGSPDVPVFDVGTETGLEQAEVELQISRNNLHPDTAARRALALEALDQAPALLPLYEKSAVLGSRVGPLMELVTAAADGYRTPSFVDEVENELAIIQQAMDSMTEIDPATGKSPLSSAQEMLVQLEELRAACPDESVREDLKERIDTINGMLQFFDPASPHGQNIQHMLQQMENDQLDESGFLNWLASDGLRTLGAVAASVALVMAMGPAGAGVAGLVWMGYGGAVGEDIFADFQHDVCGYGAGSMHTQAEDGDMRIGADGNLEQITTQDADRDFLMRVGQGALLAGGCRLASKFIGGAIQSLRGPAASAAPRTSAQIVSQVQQVSRVTAGASSTTSTWINQYIREVGGEVVEEGFDELGSTAIEIALGETNMGLSMLLSAMMGSRSYSGNLDTFKLSRDADGNNYVTMPPNINHAEAMGVLARQLEIDGMQVTLDDNQLTVTSPAGIVQTFSIADTAVPTNSPISSSEAAHVPSSETETPSIDVQQDPVEDLERAASDLTGPSEPLVQITIGDWSHTIGPGQETLVVGSESVGGDRTFSRRHAEVGRDDNGELFVRDIGSTNGTYVNGNRIPPFVEVALKPGDRVRFGLQQMQVEAFGQQSSIMAEVRSLLRAYNTPSDPAAEYDISTDAHIQSLQFADFQQLNRKILDGFMDAGSRHFIDENGQETTRPRRYTTVVDRRTDIILAEVADIARERFLHLPPRERAIALNQFVKGLLEPSPISDQEYDDFVAEHRGEKIPLGEFIRQGYGVCAEQALLMKVLGDSLELEIQLVRGSGTGNDRINHAWTEVILDGGEALVFDPRHEIHGETYQAETTDQHRPGRDIVSRRIRGESDAPIDSSGRERASRPGRDFSAEINEIQLRLTDQGHKDTVHEMVDLVSDELKPAVASYLNSLTLNGAPADFDHYLESTWHLLGASLLPDNAEIINALESYPQGALNNHKLLDLLQQVQRMDVIEPMDLPESLRSTPIDRSAIDGSDEFMLIDFSVGLKSQSTDIQTDTSSPALAVPASDTASEQNQIDLEIESLQSEISEILDDESQLWRGYGYTDETVERVADTAARVLSERLPGVSVTGFDVGASQFALLLNDGTVLKIQTHDDWGSNWGKRPFDVRPLRIGEAGPYRINVGEGGDRWIVYRQPFGEEVDDSRYVRIFRQMLSRAGAHFSDGGPVEASASQIRIFEGRPRLVDYEAVTE